MNGVYHEKPDFSKLYESLELEDELGLMVEPTDIEEVEATYQYDCDPADDPTELMFEAITTNYARLNRTMDAFGRALNRSFAGTDITAGDVQLGKARRTGQLVTVAALFPLSDGQSISIIFHSPTAEGRLTADDTVVAFRFLLNKKDVSHTVAPQGGLDISLKAVTLKLSNLAERNSAKFQLKQGEVKKQQAQLDDIQKNIDAAGEQSTQVSDQADQLEADASKSNQEIAAYSDSIQKTQARIDKLQRQLAKLSKVDNGKAAGGTEKTPESQLRDSPEYKKLFKGIKSDLATINDIQRGNAPGYDKTLFAKSIYGKLQTLKKNGKQDLVDLAINDIAEMQNQLLKPAFTDRHGIWKLSSQYVDPNTLPTSAKANDTATTDAGKTDPAKDPETDPANEPVAPFESHYYGVEAGSIAPPQLDGFIDRMDEGQFRQDPQVNNMVQSLNTDLQYVLVYDRELTIQEIAANRLIVLDGSEAIDALHMPNEIAGIDFTHKTSNLVSKYFGETWDAIGKKDPDALSQIVDGDPEVNEYNRDEIMRKVVAYAVNKKLADATDLYKVKEFFWYGMPMRPFMLGTVPNRNVAYMDPEQAGVLFPAYAGSRTVRFGAVAYAKELSSQDISNYELLPLSKNPKAPGLSEEDISYIEADITAAIDDTYAENGKITKDTYQSLIDSFNKSPNWIYKVLKNTYSYQNRQRDPDHFKLLQTYAKRMDVAMFATLLQPMVETPDSNVVSSSSKLKPADASIQAKFQLFVEQGGNVMDTGDTIEVQGPGFDTISIPKGNDAALVAAQGNAFDWAMKAGDIVPLEYKGFTLTPSNNDGAIRWEVPTSENRDSGKSAGNTFVDSEEAAKALVDTQIAAELAQAEAEKKKQQAETDKLTKNPDLKDKPVAVPAAALPKEDQQVKAITDALEKALTDETDAEALINLLEDSINQLTAAGAYDANEALIEKVSNRITDLLEAMA